MFKAILYTQWKWARLPLLVGAVLAFTLPVLSLQRAASFDAGLFQASFMIDTIRTWAVWYPVLATALGLLVAFTAWGYDRRGGHVYALSLPIPRWRFALLRLGAGFALLTIPAVTIALGSYATAWTTTIPVGLTAYPAALAIRFVLAMSLAFAIFFAVSAGSPRTAGYILTALAAVIITPPLLDFIGIDLYLGSPPIDHLLTWPSPLTIFSGRWMLIDV